MLVLSKKRILLMLCMVFISLYAFSFKIAIQNSETIETVAVPSSSRVIVIDAGHGTPDERSRKLKWNYRSGDKFKNSIKTAKFIRTKWKHSYIN